MPLITLTSDWNQSDNYIAGIKGELIKKIPDINLVDITHQVKAFGLSQAAYVLKNSYHHFPEGSIHLILVQSISAKNKYLVFEMDKHYFISADNGIAGLLFQHIENANLIQETEIQHSSFPEISVFVEAAAKIALNIPVNAFSTPTDQFIRNIPLQATIDENTILGTVIYIDSHRNIVTNILKEDFDRIQQKRRFEIAIGSNKYKVNKISTQYLENPVGELLALFNSSGHLEIAINQGNAADILNININMAVRIKFL